MFAVVGQQDRDALISEPGDDVLDRVDGDRIDTGEGFIEQDQFGLAGQAASNFEASSLTSGEGRGNLSVSIGDAELVEQISDSPFSIGTFDSEKLEDDLQVLSNSQLAEDTFVLRQISQSQSCSAVKRPAGDVFASEEDLSLGGRDESAGDAKRGGFAGTVGSEQANDFAGIDNKIDTIDGPFARVILDQASALQQWHVLGPP